MTTKKFISLALAMVLCLCMFSPALATEQGTATQEFDQILQIATNLLRDIRFEQDKYGLAGVDFDNLRLNDYVPTYIAKNSGMEEAEVRYYPITENEEWVATLAVAKDSVGVWNGQLSNTFVEQLPQLTEANSVTLVFDRENGYLVKDGEQNVVASYAAMEDRVRIDEVPLTRALLETQTIGGGAAIELPQTMPLADRYFYFDVPQLSQQPYKMACVGFSIKLIAQYYSRNYSIAQIYSYAYNGQQIDPNIQGINTITARLVLADDMGFNVEALSNRPSFTNLQSVLNEKTPIMAVSTLATSTGYYVGHCIVLRGYTVYTSSTTHIGSFAFMNPWSGTYQAGSIDNNTNYTYIDHMGNTQKLVDFTAVRR